MPQPSEKFPKGSRLPPGKCVAAPLPGGGLAIKLEEGRYLMVDAEGLSLGETITLDEYKAIRHATLN